jgi:hypothetical protein
MALAAVCVITTWSELAPATGWAAPCQVLRPVGSAAASTGLETGSRPQIAAALIWQPGVRTVGHGGGQSRRRRAGGVLRLLRHGERRRHLGLSAQGLCGRCRHGRRCGGGGGRETGHRGDERRRLMGRRHQGAHALGPDRRRARGGEQGGQAHAPLKLGAPAGSGGGVGRLGVRHRRSLCQNVRWVAASPRPPVSCGPRDAPRTTAGLAGGDASSRASQCSARTASSRS